MRPKPFTAARTGAIARETRLLCGAKRSMDTEMLTNGCADGNVGRSPRYARALSREGIPPARKMPCSTLICEKKNTAVPTQQASAMSHNLMLCCEAPPGTDRQGLLCSFDGSAVDATLQQGHVTCVPPPAEVSARMPPPPPPPEPQDAAAPTAACMLIPSTLPLSLAGAVC